VGAPRARRQTFTCFRWQGHCVLTWPRS